jgi:hypothetical protein
MVFSRASLWMQSIRYIKVLKCATAPEAGMLFLLQLHPLGRHSERFGGFRFEPLPVRAEEKSGGVRLPWSGQEHDA